MSFKQKVALMTVLAMIQLPCAGYTAEEDKDLAMIAAEQERSAEDERLGKINPLLKDSISTEHTKETNKDIKERQKKLKQTRKEKEKDNERKLKKTDNNHKTQTDSETIIIDPNEPSPPINQQPVTPPTNQQPITPPTNQRQVTPPTTSTRQTVPKVERTLTPTPKPVETVAMPDQKVIYSNFVEVAQAMKFIPLYMPRKSGYEITSIYAGQGIVELNYGRRWEPTVSLSVRTHKRADGEAPQDISGVTDVKWRVDTSTGTTLYIAKVSDNEQVAAWAVGHYTFSARAKNLSFAGFHSLVADELIELSTHYYIDL